uniref:Group II intron maturase-specific domain-containing protein n=1 Tax=Lympha mucosa TaxID=2045360 RepID=A0A6B9VPK1_9FLOR|nr:hypothetical protein [Lympha mucosa]
MRINNIDLKNSQNDLSNCSNNFYLLFKLQKKIYEASKQCHLSLVHALQKLLLSLKSIQSLAKSVVNKNIKLNSILKTQLINCVHIEKVDNKMFDQEINKLILHWSLDPEWKPRIESLSFTNQSLIKNINLVYKIKYTYDVSCLIYQPLIISKFIQKRYLIKKLQSFSLINNHISLLLSTTNSINYYCSLDKSVTNNILNKCTILVLLHQVLCTGLEWVGIRQIKSCVYNYYLYVPVVITPVNIIFFSQNINILKTIQLVLKKFLSNLGLNFINNKISISNKINIAHMTCYNKFHKGIRNLRMKPHIEAIQQLNRLVKNILYGKNKFGKIRAKTNLSLQKIIQKINRLLILWYKYFETIISKLYFSKITFIVDEIIYRWAKKKYKINTINLIS